jgi:hypothetical protein
MYGGRCLCAHKKEQLELEKMPQPEFDENCNNSGLPRSGSVHFPEANTVYPDSFPTIDGHSHHNPAPNHADAPETRQGYQLNYSHSLHNMSSLGSGSVDNLSHTDAGESRSGSLAAHESHQEQGQGTLETDTPELLQSSISIALQQLDNVTQLPVLDGSNIKYAAGANFQHFDALSDATQVMFGAELNDASINWSNYDLSWPSNHSHLLDFSNPDYDWSVQPTLSNVFPLTEEGVSEVRNLGTSAGVLQHSAANLLDPILHGSNAAITLPEAERQDGTPSPANGQENPS